METHTRRRNTKQLHQLTRSAIPLRQELENREAGRVRSGVEPLRDACQLEIQGVGQVWQTWTFARPPISEAKQEAAPHGHQSMANNSRILEMSVVAYSSVPRLARMSRINASGGSRSGRTAVSKPNDLSSASFRPGTAFFSCLRRLLKHAVTKTRKRGISSAVTCGSTSGVSRITALRTRGGGRNAPGATVKTFSTRATACTPTDSAPYVLLPGLAAIRSATSSCTRKTTRSGSGGVSALSINGEVM